MSSRILSTVRSTRQTQRKLSLSIRSLTTQEHILPPAYPPPPPPPSGLDPRTITTPRQERRLLRHRVFPVGSRRRRAALRTSADIPFEQLPYQCFQEARKVLAEDRKGKLEQIEQQRSRIERLKAQEPAVSGGEWQKERRVVSMQQYLEKLKILADINDPMVKKRFEDGKGMFCPLLPQLMLLSPTPFTCPGMERELTIHHQDPCPAPSTATSPTKNGAPAPASSLPSACTRCPSSPTSFPPST